MKPTINDFASFDAKQSDYFCLITPKGKPVHPLGIPYVFAFGHTAFNARSLALLFFKNLDGYQLDYDQLEVKVINPTGVDEGQTILFSDSTKCGIEVYQTVKRSTVEEIRNKTNLEKWKRKNSKKRVIELHGN